MLRLVLSVCVALMLGAAVFAQEAAPAAKASDNAAQLQVLEQETQLQMRALEEQRSTAGARDAESIEQRIADLKFQYEIRRLTILLQQAETEGDETRAAEIRRALDNWLSPPAPEITTPVQRSAPGMPDASPEVRENTR